LPPYEDSQHSREQVAQRIKAYMQIIAKPGERVTAGALRLAVIDGVSVTGAAVKQNGDGYRTDNGSGIPGSRGGCMGITAAPEEQYAASAPGKLL
jgi:hypothetical protein